MPSNGSTKIYHGLDFECHYAVSTYLLHIREQLQEVQAEVLAGYGRASVQAKLTRKLVETLDLLRGHLSHSLLSEHSERPTRELSELYYPKEPNP